VGLPAASAAAVTRSRARPLRPCGADIALLLGAAEPVLHGPIEGLAQALRVRDAILRIS
jgi:hypothetical protein